MIRSYLGGTLLALLTLSAAAQRLPQPSPAAQIKQSFGVTDLTLNYSRPALRGRTAFGADSTVVRPYGKLWRTGANAATTLETSTDLMVEGQPLPAGKYALYSVPGASEWAVVFTKNMTANENTYQATDDALRVRVRPGASPLKMESFTAWFSDLTDSTTVLNFAWGETLVPVKLMAQTSALMEKSIADALATKPDDAGTLMAAANYNLSRGRNLEQSLGYVDKALASGENLFNLWTKAQLLGKLGRYAEAIPVAQKALTVGATKNANALPFMQAGITQAIGQWQGMLPKVTPAVPGMGKKKKS
jgi:hypothetical protein